MSKKDPLPIPESLEQLLDQLYIYIPGAVRFACHRYQQNISQDEFQDLCQEIILLLIDDDYHHLRDFDPGKASLKTWIYMIVKSYMRRRLKGKDQIISLEDITANSFICRAEQENVLLSGERWRAIHKALARLPKRSQALFILSAQGYSDAEIARLLGIKVDKVRKQRYECVKKLKRLFTKMGS